MLNLKQAAQAVIDAYISCDSPEALQIAIDNLREALKNQTIKNRGATVTRTTTK
jgi:hypothetical protein